MTTAHLPKRNPRHCLIGQTIAGPSPARALGRKCHVKPDSHNSHNSLPACITATWHEPAQRLPR